jgi:hypothetical protein
MRLSLTVLFRIVMAAVVLSVGGCALLHPKAKNKPTAPIPGSGKVVVTPRTAPKVGAKADASASASGSGAEEPQVTLLRSDGASKGVVVVPMGPYRGNRLMYFVGCTNYQKEPIQFGTQNITVTDGRGTVIPLHVPKDKNIFGMMRDLWFRHPNYQKQLLWPTFTIQPQLTYGGIVIVEESPITNFTFDFAGEQCTASFSVK